MEVTRGSDAGLGLTLVLGLVAVAGAAVAFAGPSQFLAALGFGTAVTAGVLAVSALHLFDGTGH